MIKNNKRLLFIASVFFSLSTLSIYAATNSKQASAAPSEFTVTNTNDSGIGSLRQAIEDANDNNNPSDMDTIIFDINGSSVHRIVLASALPPVTEKVTIDGYTQTDASANTVATPGPIDSVIKIEIEDDVSGSETLRFNTGSEESILRGVSIFGDANSLVYIDADDVSIFGNYIGTDATGIYNPANQNSGVQNGIAVHGDGVVIGGLSPQHRNVITNKAAGDSSGSIGVLGDQALIRGNYIGIGRDGSTDLGQVQGAVLQGQGNSLGGSANGSINVVAGGSNVQITLLMASGAKIQGNYIGTDHTGEVSPDISNGAGVSIAFMSEGNLIGGTSASESNTIKGVGGIGVAIAEIDYPNIPLSFLVSKNAVLGNKISHIGVLDYFAGDFGDTNLGIDIFKGISLDYSPGPPQTFEKQGPTANDDNDSDNGANGYINTPVLRTAQQVGNQIEVAYDLDALDSPDDEYRIEFFANDESTIFGAGPAQELIGVVETATNGEDQLASFAVSGDYTNKAISATTTALDPSTDSGFGATSELSRNISVGSEDDFDSDGAPDDVEDQFNNGDANSDGIFDRLQPTVTTYEIDSTGIFATFITEGCSENGTVASIDVSSLAKQDDNYEYPYGLTDFRLNCSRGDTVNITKYIWDDISPENYIVRKYNPVTEEFKVVEDSSITNVTLGGNVALKLEYSITDGGELDDDSTANGIIVDPVGVAVLASSTNPFDGIGVPNTGLSKYWLLDIKH